jgi:hypothetical protein
LYQPFLSWWFQFFSTAEWLMLTASTFSSGILSWFFGPDFLAVTLLLFSACMVLTTLGTSFLAGIRAVRNKRWKGSKSWRGLFTVGSLQVFQPLARTAGRIKGRWHLRNSTSQFKDSDLLYGNLEKRDVWLRNLLEHMKSCGWVARPCNEWDDADIEVLGPGPYTLKLISVYEEDLQRGLHYVRYKIKARVKLHAPLMVGGMMAVLIGFTQALYLSPLAIPVIFILARFVKARKLMIQAVSQMAMECGWPIGMPRAKEYY